MKRAATTLLTGLLCLTPVWAQSAFPAPNSTSTNRRPNIGYDFGTSARNMELLIDGRDMTQAANRNGNTINIQLNYDIDPGQHQVQARAINILGLPIGTSWSFTVLDPNNNNNNNNNNNGNGSVTQMSPAMNGRTHETRPRISANFSENLRSGRAWLDGTEVTQLVGLSGGNIAFTPNQDLANGNHQVALQVVSTSGRNYNYNWSFEVRQRGGNNGNNGSNAFTNLSPTAGASGIGSRPTISADFGQMSNVRLRVDNTDVTSQAVLTHQRISWTPNYNVDFGNHTARVEGTLNGRQVSQDWNFTVGGNNNDNNNNNGNNNNGLQFGVDRPLTGDRVNRNFQVTGQAPAGKTVKVVIKPLPNRNKVIQFQAKANNNGYYSVPVTTPDWVGRGMRMEITVKAITGRGQANIEPIVMEVYRR